MAPFDFSSPPFRLVEVSGTDAPGCAFVQSRSARGDGVAVLARAAQARTVRLEGIIEDPSYNDELIRDAKRRLYGLGALHAGEGMLRHADGDAVRRIGAWPDGGARFLPRRFGEPYLRFAMAFFCPGSFWEDDRETVIEVGYYGMELELSEEGLAVPEEGIEVSTVLNPQGMAVTVTNDGDAGTPVDISFSGPATNPAIVHRESGRFLKIQAVLAVHDAVRVTGGFGCKDVRLAREYGEQSAMQLLDLDSEFLSLDPGVQTLSFVDEVPDEGATAVVRFRRRWAGV